MKKKKLTREDREDIEAHMAVMNDPDTEWISLQELHDEIRSDRQQEGLEEDQEIAKTATG